MTALVTLVCCARHSRSFRTSKKQRPVPQRPERLNTVSKATLLGSGRTKIRNQVYGTLEQPAALRPPTPSHFLH